MRQSAYKRTETEFLFDLKHTHNFDEISIEKVLSILLICIQNSLYNEIHVSLLPWFSGK